MQKEISTVLEKLHWMQAREIWPNGLRYLWTDAFGVVLLVSLYHELGEFQYLDQAARVVAEVDRVLGLPVGIRIGEAADRDGQYFHYLAMWLYALNRLGEVRSEYKSRAVTLAREIHPHFVQPGVGVIWKMTEDLSGPYPGSGLGALDHFHGYVVYRLLDPVELEAEIAEMKELVEVSYRSLHIEQDLGLGMILWLSHFFPEEPWAELQRERALAKLDRMWVNPPGYFCRYPALRDTRFAFTNYGVSLGLQAVDMHPERVDQLNTYFETYRSGDHYDTEAITHVMGCVSHFPGEFVRAYLQEAID